MEMKGLAPTRRLRHAAAQGLAVVLLLCGVGFAHAEIVQGSLQLQWGDPRGGVGQPAKPGKFNATLVADDGSRHVLDAAQARRAAGDLYALSNRRVAVAFSPAKRAGGLRSIEAIVPVEPVRVSASARVTGMAKAVTGTTRWVTLACKFSDVATEQKPVTFFQDQYGTAPGQLGHYWNEVSYGKINLAGSTAHGWFTLPHPRSHYITTVDGEDDADLDQLFEDCVAAADPTVDFAGVQGINMMFNGDLDGSAWGGGACGPVEGVANACIRSTWNPPWAFNNLAPLAHEMGHGYGLPHSDNSDGDDDTYDNPWDVMSDSWRNAVSSPTFGTLPKHINVYQRERLGWVNAARKQAMAYRPGTRVRVNLDHAHLPGSNNTQMLVLSMSAQADPYAGTLYVLEARKRSGTYENKLAGDAVIIHKLQNYGTAYSIDAAMPPANVSNNEGSMFKVGETWVSPDESQWVMVEAETATGFIVSVGPKPRIMSSPLPSRQSPSAVSAPQGSRPSSSSDHAPAPHIAVPGCAAPERGKVLAPGRCSVPIQ
jgi:hypothetical protein